jgi:uncharacterized membrane protein YgcG
MRLRLSVLAILLCALIATTALAQSGYPQPRDNYVNDFANVLSTDAESYIRIQLEAVEARDDIEMSVVTIGSIGDYTTSARSFEAFATGLFNTWGVGDATRGDGILLLVAVEDREVRVELGEGYSVANNNDAEDLLNENILPAFRRGDYQTGIVNGVRALINEFTGVLPPLPPSGLAQSQPTPIFTQQAAREEDEEGDQSGMALLVLFVVILGGWWLIQTLSTYSSGNAADGWAGDPDSSDTWDQGDTNDDHSSSTTRRSWSSSSSRRSSSSSSRSSSSSSSRRSSFGGGRSKGGGASGKW